MTEYPTIRIKCEETARHLALMAAINALDHPVGFTAIDRNSLVSFWISRTKTGVSVRQIVDGRAV